MGTAVMYRKKYIKARGPVISTYTWVNRPRGGGCPNFERDVVRDDLKPRTLLTFKNTMNDVLAHVGPYKRALYQPLVVLNS